MNESGCSTRGVRDVFRFDRDGDARGVQGPLLEHDSYVETLKDRTFTSGFPIVRIEYTDEAIRAMCRAERRVIHETRGEIHDRFELNRPGRPGTSMAPLEGAPAGKRLLRDNAEDADDDDLSDLRYRNRGE